MAQNSGDQNLARKNKIKHLVEGSIFIDGEEKELLLRNIEMATEEIMNTEEFRTMEEWFLDAELHQKDMLAKLVKADPKFVGEMKNFKQKQVSKAYKEMEQQQRATENPEDLIKKN